MIRNEFPSEVFEAILPVLDQIAREQASANFAGTYIDLNTNSSLTVSTDPQNSGLVVTRWISNGADVLRLLEFTTPDIVWRLQPNQIDYGSGKVGFTSYFSSATQPSKNADTFLECVGWFAVDEFNYGNIPLGQMVFDVRAAGGATAVELRAFRMTMQREE